MSLVSVIVPARDAVGTLGDTLAGLAALELPPGAEVELLVVDNGSRDETAEIAAAAGARVLCRPRGAGPGAARNDGAAAARGEILAFLDADCVPTRSWLAAALAVVERGADLVQSPVAPDPAQPFAPWDRSLWVHGPPGSSSPRTSSSPARPSRAPGASRPASRTPPARRRSARTPCSGGRPAAPAPALGPRRPGAPRGVRTHRPPLRGRQGPPRPLPAPGRPRAGLRATLLTAGLFLSRRTAAVDLALLGAGVAALTRRRAPLLLAAPYARVLARTPRRAPVHLAADLTAALALVRGSLRERTPVL